MAVFLVVAQAHAGNLFSDPGAKGLSHDTPAEPYIKRSRSVTLNLGSLEAAKPSQPSREPLSPDQESTLAPAASEPLFLNLFPDVNLQVAFSDLHGNMSGSMTWTGKVEGVDDSLVLLVINDGIMIGNITVNEKQYEVRYIGNNLHVIREIDQSGFPSEADPDTVAYPTTTPLADPISAARDGLNALDTTVFDGRETKRVIDVMVVYTSAARINQGGTTAIQNLINLAVAETNIGYTNSGINQELNLVHTAEVSYTESGDIGLDRDRLKNPSDGYMDNVHTLRDTYDADLVPLIVDNGGGYCGIAYIMDPVTPQFEDSGFCVVADECATGYYSFGHELGHIMGARHDWYVDPTDNSPYTYNHALTNPTDSWRTIMAYNNACTAVGGSCTRLLYWSNPDETYGGDAMGTREGELEAKDNRKTLANTGFVVANFRVKDVNAEPSKEFPSGATPNNSHNGVMFNLRAKKETTVHGFAAVFDSGGTVSRVEIYYREGSYTGFLTDPSAWKLAGSATGFTVQASPAQTHIPIDLDITIPADQTYAFYITTPSESIRYSNGTSEGAVFASDNSLQLMEGRGVAYPFSTSYSPRVFAGTVYHSFSPAPEELATAFSPNSMYPGFMFDVKAKKKITLHSFSMGLHDDNNSIMQNLEVYYRPGGLSGHETTPGDWTLLGAVDNIVASSGYFSPPYLLNRIPLDLNLTIPGGQTYGFYVTSTLDDTSTSGICYTSAPSTIVNNDLEILPGAGVRYPFYSALSPRFFAGTVYYSLAGFPWPMALPAIINTK